MKRLIGVKSGLGLLLSMGISSAVFAQDPVWFVGVGQGGARADEKFESPSGEMRYEGSPMWKLFGGYWVSPHFGVEVGYNVLGISMPKCRT